MKSVLRVITAKCALIVLCIAVAGVSNGEDTFDRNRVKQLYDKSKAGNKLTDEEQKYLDHALQELRKPNDKAPDRAAPAPGNANENKEEQKSTGLKPLTEMA